MANFFRIVILHWRGTTSTCDICDAEFSIPRNPTFKISVWQQIERDSAPKLHRTLHLSIYLPRKGRKEDMLEDRKRCTEALTPPLPVKLPISSDADVYLSRNHGEVIGHILMSAKLARFWQILRVKLCDLSPNFEEFSSPIL
jgi:hypothetical protein